MAVTVAMVGCHSDTSQGGGQDRGRSGTSNVQQHPTPQPNPVPANVPSADQMDPNSPKAVLNGTSTTTQPTQGATGSTQPAQPSPTTGPK